LHLRLAIRYAYPMAARTGESSGVPEYYKARYEKLYGCFSHVYDPFVRSMLFIINGGFGGEQRLRQQGIDWLDPRPRERILDLCSGTGTLAIMIGKRFKGQGEVVGIEISTAQLRVARRKRRPPGVYFIRADAQHVPFPDNSFDKANIFGALHEMPREVRLKVLSEALRLVRPSGRLVVMEHHQPVSRWKAALWDLLERLNPERPTLRDLLACGLTAEIESVGFRLVKTRTAAWDLFEVVLAEKPD
jgi:ubiquinone/menaquinone biosynthesis C-methylase UbiE